MRKFLAFLFIFTLAVSFWAGKVIAKEKPQILEENGTYDDPDFPGIKVRVFVHKEKPAKDSLSSLTCNLLDPDSTATVGAEVWRLPSTWTYNLNVSSVPASVGASNLPTIARNGFDDWTSASSNKVKFARGTDTTVSKQAYDRKNILAWGRTSGTALAVTYIRYNSSGQVVDVDTIMNLKFSWSWTNQAIYPACADPSSYDAEDIMTHELGHWLGLDDEYTLEYVNATMYGYGSKSEVKKDTLTTGDIAGTAAIYR